MGFRATFNLLSQQLNATYHNIVGPSFASSGQMIATLLGTTCCLATMLRRAPNNVAICYVCRGLSSILVTIDDV